MVFDYLPRSVKNGAKDPIAKEKMHNAATIAGMAFANAFLGICHSMAHKLGGTHHIAHGLANALLISHVIRYNASDKPFKQTCFPQYGAWLAYMGVEGCCNGLLVDIVLCCSVVMGMRRSE
jgi:acetaldehyde dehydrogenase/alcohol dehydrogenase